MRRTHTSTDGRCRYGCTLIEAAVALVLVVVTALGAISATMPVAGADPREESAARAAEDFARQIMDEMASTPDVILVTEFNDTRLSGDGLTAHVRLREVTGEAEDQALLRLEISVSRHAGAPALASAAVLRAVPTAVISRLRRN